MTSSAVARSSTLASARATENPAGRRLPRVLGRWFGLLAISATFSLLMLRHHVLPLSGVVEPGGDYGLMTWNLWIVNESITAGHNPYVTNLVYFPLGARLAKHTLVPGFWPLTFLVDKLTGNDPLYPVYAYRLCILLSFSLALAFSYVLLRQLGFGLLACLLPAIQYTFSDFDMLHVPHLNHISAAFLLPASALALVRLFQAPHWGRSVAAGVVLGAGVYFSELIVFLYLALPIALLLGTAFPETREDLRLRLKRLGVRGALAGLLAFGLTIGPFLMNWAADSGKAPLPRQASNWSANLAGFFIPNPDYTPLYGRLFAGLSAGIGKGIGGHEVFVGFPLLLFAALGLLRKPRGWTAITGCLAFLFFALSLGPVLKVWNVNTGIPMPYALLMQAPPFDMGRTPVRCILMALFCLSLLAAIGLHSANPFIRARCGTRFATGAGLLVLAWGVAEVYSPAPPSKPYRPPPALEALAPGPVVNIPLSVFDGHAVFLQTLHGHPIATGFVSRRTPPQVESVRELDRLLAEDVDRFVMHLQAMGIRNIILDPGTPADMAEKLRDVPLTVVDLRRQEGPVPPPAQEEPVPSDRLR